jgi:hypothetical protein
LVYPEALNIEIGLAGRSFLLESTGGLRHSFSIDGSKLKFPGVASGFDLFGGSAFGAD